MLFFVRWSGRSEEHRSASRESSHLSTPNAKGWPGTRDGTKEAREWVNPPSVSSSVKTSWSFFSDDAEIKKQEGSEAKGLKDNGVVGEKFRPFRYFASRLRPRNSWGLPSSATRGSKLLLYKQPLTPIPFSSLVIPIHNKKSVKSRKFAKFIKMVNVIWIFVYCENTKIGNNGIISIFHRLLLTTFSQ